MTFVEVKFSAKMAIDTVREHKMRSLLTVLGVIIGTGCVIAVGSIITGVDGAIAGEVQVLDEPRSLLLGALFAEHVAQREHLLDRGASGRRNGLLDARDHRVGDPLRDGQDHGVLGREVEVERALGNSGGPHYVADGGVGHSPFRERGRRRRHQIGAAGFSIDGSWHRHSGLSPQTRRR